MSMQLDKGDLIRVSFNHRHGGTESAAGIVTEYKPLLGDAQEVQFTPGEFESSPSRLFEVVFGRVSDKFRASYRPARPNLKLIRNGEYNAELNWTPKMRKLSHDGEPGIIVKAISGGDVQYYPDILNRVRW